MNKLSDKIKNMSEKNIYRALLIIFICSMIPILYLGRFAVPSLDDYYFGIRPHRAWLETHSLGALIQGAIDMVKYYYEVKQATYTSIFLMALFPGVIDERWYFLTPIILSGMIIGSVTALVHVLISDVLGVKSKYLSGITNILILFLVFQTLLVPLEAIYWYNGGTHYVFMQSALYFEIAAILHGINLGEDKKRIKWIVIASLLGILVGGGNLISGLQGCILGALYVIYLILTKISSKSKKEFLVKLGFDSYKKSRWLFVIPVAFTYIAYAFNALAPCNSLRAEVETQMNPIKAVINSFYWGAVYSFSWITPMSIIVFAIVTVIIWRLSRNTKRSFIHPLVMAVISYCVFSAMLTPTWYAMSSDAPNRVKNIIGTARLIILFINIVNDCGYLQKNTKNQDFLPRLFEVIEEKYKTVIIVGALIIGFMFLLTADKNTYTSISALRSIANGEAARYYSQSMERIKLYNDETQPDVIVQPITDDAKPYLLFKEDIGDEEGEEGYWQNIEISEFYGKNSISVND